MPQLSLWELSVNQNIAPDLLNVDLQLALLAWLWL